MIIDKAIFTAALAPVLKIARESKIFPILNHVVLARQGDGLVIRATNLDEEIIVTVKAELEPDFEDLACPAYQLGEFVKNAAGSEIAIKPIRERDTITSVSIASGRSKLRLLTLRADDLPTLETGPLDHGFTCDGQILAKALKAVIYAADDDKARPYLHGAFIEPTHDGLVFVATDGYRLVRRLIPILAFDDDAALADIPSAILPTAGVSRLLGLIGEGSDVTLELSKAKFRATVGNVTMISKLVDATFPDYRRVIPAKGANRVTFNAATLGAALTRVALTAPDKKGMLFAFTPGTLSLSASNAGIGDGQDAIDVDGDAEVAINFNVRYVQDLLTHGGAERMEIHLADAISPAILHAPDDGENFTVLMAIRG